LMALAILAEGFDLETSSKVEITWVTFKFKIIQSSLIKLEKIILFKLKRKKYKRKYLKQATLEWMKWQTFFVTEAWTVPCRDSIVSWSSDFVGMSPTNANTQSLNNSGYCLTTQQIITKSNNHSNTTKRNRKSEKYTLILEFPSEGISFSFFFSFLISSFSFSISSSLGYFHGFLNIIVHSIQQI
jgi:hypothetical protein